MLRRQPRGHQAEGIVDDYSCIRVRDYRFDRRRRLRAQAEFAALLQAPRTNTIRVARRFLGVIAGWKPVNEYTDATRRVRFGVIVGRRNVGRAVDRALVKRVVREACRHQACMFDHCAARLAVCIDIVLRVKSPLLHTDGALLAMRQWRRELRSEADDLLQHVLAELPARVRPANDPES
jgi:ribonuclease P protein component